MPAVDVIHADGSDLDEAGRVAQGADAVVVVVGCTYEDEGEYIAAQPELLFATAPPRPARPAPSEAERSERRQRTGGGQPQLALGGDRVTLDLSDRDQALIRTAAATNRATAVVLMGGSAILVEGWHDLVPAIVALWYPGMEGGRALADVLLGRVAPTGRLPFAVPRDAGHLPAFDRDATAITYDLFHGQWLLDRDGHAARYPFGFGLSYGPPATIEHADVVREERGLKVSARLMNESDRAVTEVVQAYVGVRGGRLERPAWRLGAFRRVEVLPANSVNVELSVPYDRLAVRADGAWTVEHATYEIAVGRHARDPNAAVVSVDLPGRVLSP
jgi:beta-glucosidase